MEVLQASAWPPQLCYITATSATGAVGVIAAIALGAPGYIGWSDSWLVLKAALGCLLYPLMR